MFVLYPSWWTKYLVLIQSTIMSDFYLLMQDVFNPLMLKYSGRMQPDNFDEILRAKA